MRGDSVYKVWISLRADWNWHAGNRCGHRISDSGWTVEPVSFDPATGALNYEHRKAKTCMVMNKDAWVAEGKREFSSLLLVVG